MDCLAIDSPHLGPRTAGSMYHGVMDSDFPPIDLAVPTSPGLSLSYGACAALHVVVYRARRALDGTRVPHHPARFASRHDGGTRTRSSGLGSRHLCGQRAPYSRRLRLRGA